MKGLLGLASAAVCALAIPVSVQALPVYATLIARDHCEYLSYGWGWNDAISQALSDNSHWFDDIELDGDRAHDSIVIAINKECRALNRAAFTNR